MAKKQSATEEPEYEAPATMKPEIVLYHICGVTGLLQNNPIELISNKSNDSLGTKRVYNDEEEAAIRLYPLPDGNFGLPSEAFLRAMVKAAAGKKIGKMFATSALKGAVFAVEPHCVIEDAKCKPAKKHEIDRRPVVVGTARVLRCRPVWKVWRTTLALDIDTAIVSPQTVLDCLCLAGRIVGVGDYRPECGGGFGRFTAAIKK